MLVLILLLQAGGCDRLLAFGDRTDGSHPAPETLPDLPASAERSRTDVAVDGTGPRHDQRALDRPKPNRDMAKIEAGASKDSGGPPPEGTCAVIHSGPTAGGCTCTRSNTPVEVDWSFGSGQLYCSVHPVNCVATYTGYLALTALPADPCKTCLDDRCHQVKPTGCC